MQIKTDEGSMNMPAPDTTLNIRGPILFGLLVVVAFFGTVGAWASLAELESAAIAPGIVHASSKRKTIQHLEGGIVKDIQVKEGALVAAGDVLITLDNTRSAAELEKTQNRLISALARESRLVAERDLQLEIDWSDRLQQFQSSTFAEQVKSSQTNEFLARKRSIDGQVAILNQRIEQIKTEKQGVGSQINSQDKQIDLIEDELASMERLFEKGFTGKSRLLELQRNVVEVKGSRSQNVAALSRIDQTITETQLQITDLGVTRMNEVLASLRETQAEIQELTDTMLSLRDVVSRTEIVAPLSGMVVGLEVFTRGGVIGSGQDLLDIVPAEDGLVIEARVDPVDIDVVRSGLEAEVRFSSFNQRSTLPSAATVLTISADHLTDERTGASYFLARVVLSEDELSKLELPVTPGMPAEVMILTGTKTPLQYFLEPITNSFNRAFRES